MIEVINREDKSICTTSDYENNPDKYRGLIDCLECGRKAWFIKGYETEKINRMACFAAKHVEGCEASTVVLGSDDSEELENGNGEQNSDIRIDLDKLSSQSIYTSKDNLKHGDEDSNWKNNKQKKGLGNADGFPLNKSLRQLLSNLCRNPDYAEIGQTITIVADSGRVVLAGELRDHLVKIEDVGAQHIGRDHIFWGTINNLNTMDDGTLWLNYGDYRKEPSIRLTRHLKEQLLRNFKLAEVSELDGSEVIIVGHVGFSSNGKAILQTGFTKYMSFRRRKVLSASQ